MKLQDFTDNPRSRFKETVRILREQGELVPDFENMTHYKADAEIKMLREYRDTLGDPVDRQRISVVIESLDLWKRVVTNERTRRLLWEELSTGVIESAKCIMAAEDVKEELMGMLEAISKIQATKILNIVNGMKAEEEFTTETANEFSESVKEIVQGLHDALTHAVDDYGNAIAKAQGKETGSGLDGDDGLGDPDAGMDMDGDAGLGDLPAVGEPGEGDGGPGEGPGAAVGGLGDGIGDDEEGGLSGLDGAEGGGRSMKDEA